MEQVYIKESNSEVLICIDRNMGDKEHALEEAAKILQRELLRVKANGHNSW